MFKKIFIAVICCFVSQILLHAQCPNLDFSQRDFTNWKCAVSFGYSTNGSFTTSFDTIKWIDTCPLPDRHAIITDFSEYTADAKGCYRVSCIPDGMRQTVRLGVDKEQVCTDAKSIRYVLDVDSSNAILLLHYAYFLYRAHPVSFGPPRFGYIVRDTCGSKISFFETLGVPISVYSECDEKYNWAPWAKQAVDLRKYIGQKVELVFYATDCGQSSTGHFGYAYVTSECRPAKIDVQCCSGNNVAQLSAPDGFVEYEWTDSAGKVVGDRSKLRLTNPKEGAVYSCKLKPQNGNAIFLGAEIKRTFVDADFAFVCDTLGLKLHLMDKSGVIGSSVSRICWEVSGEDSGTLFVSGDSVADYPIGGMRMSCV